MDCRVQAGVARGTGSSSAAQAMSAARAPYLGCSDGEAEVGGHLMKTSAATRHCLPLYFSHVSDGDTGGAILVFRAAQPGA